MSKNSNSKSSWFFLGGFLLLLLLCLIHLTQGQAGYTAGMLLREVWHEGRVQDIVLGLRLPRAVIGILAGGALAVAGAILQTLTKNPLASASTLGLNAGAYFFVVLSMIFFPGYLSKFPFLVSFLGAAFSAVLMVLLVGKMLEPVRVTLTGMIISLLFASVTGALQLIFENETNGLFLWGSGTLIQLDWGGVQFAAPVILLGVILALIVSKSLDLLSLGDDTARSLGQSVLLVKGTAWFTAILLAAVTVSVVGPIGFIGLMAPHIVRLLGIREHRALMVHSFLWGAVLLVGADVLGRWISSASEIPVGAMTALIGAPWLMYLAYKAGKEHKKGEGRLGGYSWSIPYPMILLGLVFITIVMLVVSISYGGTTFFTLQNWMNMDFTAPFVWEFRIPRIFTAFLVGMLLAMCGVLLQGVLRNPLADPTIMGITSGGGAGALIFLVLLPTVSIQYLPVAAMIGSGVAITVILLVTWRSEWQPVLLALMGVSVSAIGAAIIQILIVKAKIGVAPALAWLAGSTYAKGWDDFKLLLIVALIAIPLGWLISRRLDTIALGDDVSIILGMRVPRTKILAILIGVAVGAASVSVVGTIGFIGLLAPHAARRMVGIEHRRLLPVALLLGGILLVGADFLGRFVLAPKEIPSGLVVALLGTPYLLYIMKKSSKKS
ncbi:Fe(3+)-hydroxamate ABC transporter permease FhuB [Bacillus horti]|uniref:Iron complex transport system permease protein n=1 Tax=Caldalkalibacillus horti TaxID=77523 RepID=A0ABT9VVK8_9BACI|nr:Fe(3+)-hydroxamate ABC transporter permease FhuB [Bacillus horti]MDQ0165021.1 iron complex transport system permease protein [Bacillus horti]